MHQQIKKPLDILQNSLNENISIKLKNNIEYKGKMANVDAFMNVIIENASEYSDGVLQSSYGNVIIRGNNILFIKLDEQL